MKPSERYHNLAIHINYCFKVVGLEILTPRLKFNYRTWATITFIVQFAVFGIRWMIIQAQISWLECLKTGIMMGAMVNGASEVTTLILRHSDMRRLVLSTQQLFEDYESRNEAYCNALHVGLDRIQVIAKVIRFGYFISYFVMSMVPLGYLLYDGTRMTIVQHEIKGLSIEDNYGYILTFFVQFVNMFIAGVGFYAADLLGCTCLTMIVTYADILQLKAQTLNEALDRKVEARRTGKVGAKFDGDDEIEELLLETIRWHQLLTEYSFKIDHIYHIMITGQVLSAAISLLSTSCVNLSEFHLNSLIYFVVTSYKLLVFCIVGTKIEYAYDQVYDIICNISWQELKGSQRKMFGMMLKTAQTAQTLNMLGIMPLSVRTALQITKLIYSLTMMMKQNRT